MTFSVEYFCSFCNKNAEISCKNCDLKFCGKSHQSFHLDEQSQNCYPFKIEEAEGVGRYLVASRHISAGETIFKDIPVGVGPNQETSPICLTCNSKIDCSFTCSDCWYPLCNEECADSENHLDLCQILSADQNKQLLQFEKNDEDNVSKINQYAYHAILPLRLILLKKTDPERLALVERLMDHNDMRRKDPFWNECEEKVVSRIRIGCGRSDIDGSELHRIIGILETNAYEIYNNGTCGFRGLFTLSSLMSHGCMSNVIHQWSTEPPYINTCKAAVDIQKGEEILSTYVKSNQCTLTRRKRLRDCWYFECKCRRCRDPTEMGSFAGAIICQSCLGTSKNPHFMVSVDPLNFDSDYECENCGNKEKSDKVESLVKEYSEKICQLSLDYLHKKEEFITLYNSAIKVFHPHHEILTEIAIWLVPILCRSPGKSPTDFPLSEITLKRNLSKMVIEVLNILSPGINRRRGKFYYELAETEVSFLSNGFDDQNISDYKDFRSQMMDIVEHCEESIRCLSNIGPLTRFEQTLLRSAQKLRENAKHILSNVL